LAFSPVNSLKSLHEALFLFRRQDWSLIDGLDDVTTRGQ